MALDFPNSPANGDVYGAYVYDSSLPGWRSKGGAVAATYVSDTAPSGAVKGDMWYRSSDGTTYVYVVDVDTSQWVEIRSEVAATQTGLAPVVPTSASVGTGSATVAANGMVTFTGATSISLNGVFTSTFRNYKIIGKYRNSTNSNTTAIQLRMRASSADLTSADWVFGGTNTTTTSAGAVTVSNWGAWGGNLCQFGYFSPNYSELSMEIAEPNIATPTGIFSNAAALNTSTNAHYSQTFNGGFNSNAVADGFTIFSGTTDALSGTIQVYGFR